MIEHKTISLADQVFDHLENDILSGKYQRGEILTEENLSATFGMPLKLEESSNGRIWPVLR